MFVLGIQGSPRKDGNSEYLLNAVLKEFADYGAVTEVIRPQDQEIQPCKELLVCEKKGICPIRDEMETLGYEKVRQADVVVLASPVFFYGISAQAKVFIDRCQMFWGRKYKLGLRDPDRYTRQGFLLSVGASGGKRLFEGVELTARYFFDAISADYAGSLTYNKVEDAGDIIARPELAQEIQEAVAHMLGPEKPGLLFASPGRGSLGLMAAAFAKELAKGKVRAAAAATEGPAPALPAVVRAMAENQLDVKYMRVFGLADLPRAWRAPDQAVFLGSLSQLEAAKGLPKNAICWDLPEPKEDYSGIRDQILDRVRGLIPV